MQNGYTNNILNKTWRYRKIGSRNTMLDTGIVYIYSLPDPFLLHFAWSNHFFHICTFDVVAIHIFYGYLFSYSVSLFRGNSDFPIYVFSYLVSIILLVACSQFIYLSIAESFFVTSRISYALIYRALLLFILISVFHFPSWSISIFFISNFWYSFS
jgi:hypothetical protein